ncbi:GDSL-type esterase/lipase family protein [Aggregatilinea lenta]|uniref:GDSL-type esterase/lipase family protein n=1 Tax=Aggregatilinea lenta TaxID=913108 RepID=UPI0013C3752F|nr:GDSL-type esterase/lipase family protein [Aggregatilinea lenta]
MRRRARLMFPLMLLALLAAAGAPLRAQGLVNAWTTVGLNLRTGPGEDYEIVVSLPAQTGLVVEARGADDADWVLGHTVDGRWRGWALAALLFFDLGVEVDALPTSDEIPAGPLEEEPIYEVVDLADGADFLVARASKVDLMDVPVVPDWTGDSARIYVRGQTLDRDARVVSKVGDCNSVGGFFLHPFGQDRYDLGAYAELQAVIDQFAASMDTQSYAAYTGLNAQAVLDSTWANPNVCEPGESALACEYRAHNPAFAVIMFGTNDMISLTPQQFDHALRRIVLETKDAGIVPILSTFPTHLAIPEESVLYNQIVVLIARDMNVPLINLWRALEPLEDRGIGGDGYHLNGPLTGAGDFASEANLERGQPLRNLVTLQALDVVWRAATGE